MLAVFIWILIKYRKRKLVLITLFNLILMYLEDWWYDAAKNQKAQHFKEFLNTF